MALDAELASEGRTNNKQQLKQQLKQQQEDTREASNSKSNTTTMSPDLQSAYEALKGYLDKERHLRQVSTKH